MDLLEKMYDEDFSIKKAIELSRVKTDMLDEAYFEIKEKFFSSLKTDEQKNLFKSFEFCIESKLESSEKENFLNGFSCGMKIGVEINNRVKNFEYKDNNLFDYNIKT